MPGPAVDPDRHGGLGDAAVDLTAALIACDSVNPALVSTAPGEADLVGMLAERLAGTGWEVEVITSASAPDRPNLLASAKLGSGQGPRLMFNGHLDTVGTEGMSEPFTARIDGDRLTGRMFGRGACDMKGGIAAMVVAADDTLHRPGGLDGELMISLVADEEHASLGAATVIEQLRTTGRLPQACLIAEPTWLDVIVAHRGFDVVEVAIRGSAAHSSQPERGVDAMHRLTALLNAIEEHDRQLRTGPAHPLVGTGSLLTTVVSAGSAPFTIADRAIATIERRTVPGEPGGTGYREIHAILEELGRSDPDLHATASLLLSREAWEVAEDPMSRRLAASLTAALRKTGSDPVRRAGAPYWMESALWGAAGVPTVVCGPAGGGMHAVHEWLDLDQLRRFTLAVRHWISQLLVMTP